MRAQNYIIRAAADEDAEALYSISVATGNSGGDASHLYQDKRLMGHIYSIPYLRLSDAHCIVLEFDSEVVGFAAGVTDTRVFEEAQERSWWPSLRQAYPDPLGTSIAQWTADQRRAHMIHHPVPAPIEVIDEFPAHLHLNLLPVAQRQGLGRVLAEQMFALIGKDGVHVAVNRMNKRAESFWTSLDFQEIDVSSVDTKRTIWLGRVLT